LRGQLTPREGAGQLPNHKADKEGRGP
jgi:hypothetical protein